MIAQAEQPLVSVIVCVYNAGDYLRPAVQSVLAQTYRNLEVLIVDDGSTDGCMQTIADLADPRTRIIRQANAGKPAAMNRALDEMRGEFYAIQDADDLSFPTRIEKQVAAMQANPDVAAVYSGHELILDGRAVAPTFPTKDQGACRRDIERFRMPAHDPTGMYRMAMVRELRYDPSLTVAEGLEYILRVGEKWPMVVLGECLYSYRVRFQSLTRSDPERRRRLVDHVIRRACSRRGVDLPAHWIKTYESNRPSDRDNNIAAHFMESACDLARAGRRWEAVKAGLLCFGLHPMAFHYHKALIYALSPHWIVAIIRSRKSL